jgi:hypothetical protein
MDAAVAAAVRAMVATLVPHAHATAAHVHLHPIAGYIATHAIATVAAPGGGDEDAASGPAALRWFVKCSPVPAPQGDAAADGSDIGALLLARQAAAEAHVGEELTPQPLATQRITVAAHAGCGGEVVIRAYACVDDRWGTVAPTAALLAKAAGLRVDEGEVDAGASFARAGERVGGAGGGGKGGGCDGVCRRAMVQAA